MVSGTEAREQASASVPPWRDVRVLAILAQVAVLLVVAVVIGFLINNLLTAMGQRNLAFTFDFLGQRAGFAINDSPVPYQPTDTYGRALLVGILNTLLVSGVGIVLATILGIIVGVARLSPNWLVRRTASTYIEIIRNTPLLLQLFVIYFVVLLQLPSVAESISLPGSIFLNQRGLVLPGPQFQPSFGVWLGVVVAGVLIAIALQVIGHRREDAGHFGVPYGWIGIGVVLVAAVLGWVVLAPVSFDLPVLNRFNFSGGFSLSTSFTALLLGLVIYTAAFIAEIVRGGIQAVRRGQLEAARALGLSEGDTLRLVIFPQALRIIVPPLTSQYLNLTKNSSLGIAVAYPDLFKIGHTMTNQTGQPISVIAVVMGVYLVISLAVSLLMNLYNRRVQVMER
jgi:general L-amino acid transport system permease protein